MARTIPTYDLVSAPYTSEDASRDNPGHDHVWVKGYSPTTPWDQPYGSHYQGIRNMYLFPATDGGTVNGGSPVDTWWIAFDKMFCSPWPASTGGLYENWHSVSATPGSDLTDDGVSPLTLEFYNGQTGTVTPGVMLPPHLLKLQGNMDNRGGQVGTDLPTWDPNNLPHIYQLPTPLLDTWYSFLIYVRFGRTDGTTPHTGFVQVWMNGTKVLDVAPVNTVRLGHSRWDGSQKAQYILDYWHGSVYSLWGYKSGKPGPFQADRSVAIKTRGTLARMGRGDDGLAECLADVPVHNTVNQDVWGVHVTALDANGQAYPNYGDGSITLSTTQRLDTDFVLPAEFNNTPNNITPPTIIVPTSAGKPSISTGIQTFNIFGGVARAASVAPGLVLSVGLFKQWINSFDSQTLDSGCSLSIDTDNHNALTATIVSATDTADTATKNITQSLPATSEGRLRFKFKPLATFPHVHSANLTFLVVVNSAGSSIVELFLFGDTGEISLFSQSNVLHNAGAILNTGIVPVTNTEYDIEVAWKKNGFIQVWIDGALVENDTPLTGATGDAVPASARVGIDHYDGTAATGWSNTISLLRITDDADTAIPDPNFNQSITPPVIAQPLIVRGGAMRPGLQTVSSSIALAQLLAEGAALHASGATSINAALVQQALETLSGQIKHGKLRLTLTPIYTGSGLVPGSDFTPGGEAVPYKSRFLNARPM